MRFEKGQSGNPGGRPKGYGDIRQLAPRHTGAAFARKANSVGEAIGTGYSEMKFVTGDPCPDCGSLLLQTESCKTCYNCTYNSGCG
jgi:hypothetical protein